MNPTTPTRKPTTLAPTTAVPTRSPLASDGCVHMAFMSLQQSQTFNYQYYTVPTFGHPGDQMYYNVTVILAGGFGEIGSSEGLSARLYQQSLDISSEFGPFSVLADDTGVFIRFYPYYVGSYFRATACPFQLTPTRMPTQIPAHGKSLTSFTLSSASHLSSSASNVLIFTFVDKNLAVNITAEGNALCAIGKAFALGGALWPLSAHCPINAFPVASMTNSSGVPVWCTWPFLTCDTRLKSVVAFDQGSKWTNWWSSGKSASPIPTAFGSLPNLQRLSLNSVKLTGTIPASIFSSLHQLTYLNMASNQLMGTIPSSINVAFVPQQGAIQLDLSGNYLTGTVPSTFAKLQYMYLRNNKVQFSLSGNCFLTSPIPSIIDGLYSRQGHCLTNTSPGSNYYIS